MPRVYLGIREGHLGSSSLAEHFLTTFPSYLVLKQSRQLSFLMRPMHPRVFLHDMSTDLFEYGLHGNIQMRIHS